MGSAIEPPLASSTGVVLQSRFGARPVSANCHFCCSVRGLQTRGAALSVGRAAPCVLVADQSIAWICFIASSVDTWECFIESREVRSPFNVLQISAMHMQLSANAAHARHWKCGGGVKGPAPFCSLIVELLVPNSCFRCGISEFSCKKNTVTCMFFSSAAAPRNFPKLDGGSLGAGFSWSALGARKRIFPD